MKEPRYVIVEKSCCGTCVHYRQHYILEQHGKLHALWYGHCHTPRAKRREPDETCPHWESAEPLEPQENPRDPMGLLSGPATGTVRSCTGPTERIDGRPKGLPYEIPGHFA